MQVDNIAPNAYVYFEPYAYNRILVPVRCKLELMHARHWGDPEHPVSDAAATAVLHPLDAENRPTPKLALLHFTGKGSRWPVNFGALRMQADWFAWEPSSPSSLSCAPVGPVLLYKVDQALDAIQSVYPTTEFAADWPLRFCQGMPYTQPAFDVHGEAHEQLGEHESRFVGQTLRFVAMCGAFHARNRFGKQAWDSLNVF
jgi:hypothetical protein